MKKLIIATENEKLINKIKKLNNIKIICKDLQYREAILEVLEKNKNIDFIIINERIPGEINIEDLIKKIKIINSKINIIFFLEKEDTNKKNKLKKLGIKNIYINNEKNQNKIINMIEENKIKNNKKDIKKNNKIIVISGENKSGKTTIINLLIINLIEKNKKILVINLNNRIEKNYLILLGKKYIKNKKELKNIEIKINKNLYFIYKIKQIYKKKPKEKIRQEIKNTFENYNQKYDYILVDIGKNSNQFFTQEIVEKSNKRIIVIDKNFLGIKEIKSLIYQKEDKDLKSKESLHIIQNKYYFNSISHSIIKNIFGKSIKISKILYNKKYKNLAKKILKNEKIKLKNPTKKQIKKILN